MSKDSRGRQMLKAYLNYPNSKVTVHGEATCPAAAPPDSPAAG